MNASNNDTTNHSLGNNDTILSGNHGIYSSSHFEYFVYAQKVFVSVLGVFGLIGNVLIFRIVRWQTSKRSTTDHIMLLVSLIDISSIVVNSVILLVTLDHNLDFHVNSVFCAARYCFFSLYFYMSVFMLTILCFDRYIKTFCADRKQGISTWFVQCYFVACFLVALLLSAPLIKASIFTADSRECVPRSFVGIYRYLIPLPRAIITILFVAIIVFVYGKIIVTMWSRCRFATYNEERSSLGELRIKRLRKITKMVICITLIQILSISMPASLPYLLGSSLGPQFISILVFNCHFLGDIANSICFIALSSNFRAGVIRSIKCNG